MKPVNEDIYIFSGTITIDAPVHGDIWCAGGTVTVNDTVTGDLVVAGGNITLRGTVLDDVRAAGGTLVVSGNIGGDLLIAGGTVTMDRSATIGGNLAASGGTITVDGHVSGGFKSSAGTAIINGDIAKNVEFKGGGLTLNGTIGGNSVLTARRIKLGDNAAIRGNVRYWTDEGEVNFGTAMQNGAVAAFDPALRTHFDQPDYKFLGFASLMAVLWYLVAAFILLWLGQWLFPKTFQKAARTSLEAPIQSLGYGFLYFVAVPVGIVLLFITVVAIPVGLIALFFYVMFLLLASMITALVGAHWINNHKNYNWRPIQLVLAALAFLIVLHLVGALPFLGWVAKIIAIFIAFGAILYNARLWRPKQVTD